MDAVGERAGEPRFCGGVAGAAEVRRAAFAEAFAPGLGLRLLQCSDPAEAAALEAMATEAAELSRKRDDLLARKTAHYFAKAFR
jgi:hypothetical protein